MLGYVKDSDIKASATLPEIIGQEEELADGWDAIYTVVSIAYI